MDKGVDQQFFENYGGYLRDARAVHTPPGLHLIRRACGLLYIAAGMAYRHLHSPVKLIVPFLDEAYNVLQTGLHPLVGHAVRVMVLVLSLCYLCL